MFLFSFCIRTINIFSSPPKPNKTVVRENGVFIGNVTFCSNKFHWFALRVGCTVAYFGPEYTCIGFHDFNQDYARKKKKLKKKEKKNYKKQNKTLR